MRATLGQIANWTHARPVAGARSLDRMAVSVTWDSRTVQPDALYVALPGTKVDGHAFVASAVEAGASGALVMEDLAADVLAAVEREGAAILRVDDTRQAFEDLAAAWRGELTATVVGVTGSSGKTTTKNLIRDVLSAGFRTVATKANQNNELGVPNTILSAERDTQQLVVEMGMRGLGQIAHSCQIARPDVGVVTNVGDAHMELLGSRENIAAAKAELLEALPDGTGVAVLNACDPSTPLMVNRARLPRRGVRILSFDGSGGVRQAHQAGTGASGGAPGVVFARDVHVGCDGRPTFELVFPTEALPCSLELRGLHNVSNALAAAAVGWNAGMEPAAIVAALEASAPEDGRQAVFETPAGVTVMDDSYNANPDSMRASLDTFCAMEVSGRRIAVLGDMGELGCSERDKHWQVGAYAASLPLDALVCVGRLSRVMAEAVRHELLAGQAAAAGEGASPLVVELDDADQAAAWLDGNLQSGDAVLLKASHAMGFDRIARGLAS